MSAKRMRVFAGPNGSGKTTIFSAMLEAAEIQRGVYVNADNIELHLKQYGTLSFQDYELMISNDPIKQFFRTSKFSPVKRQETDLWEKVSVENNKFKVNSIIDSYLAADVAEFIRRQLLQAGISFTYETVMSHEGKVQFMKSAMQMGYRVYLYYIATEDPEINVSRVNVRVAQLGHAVTPDTIRSRYYKSLDLLKNAVKQTNRAYIFDNSGQKAELIAEITDGVDVRLNDAVEIPNWVVTYLLK
jgi:predicted ABC-type ATPase